MSIKIVLADDHKVMRDGLRALIEQQTGMEVVAEAENGRSALKLACELAPDIVVMDINMPDLNGIEATRRIKAEAPGVKVIAFSMHSDRRFVSEMLKAGASGYLLKHCAFEELARAIREVSGNRTYLSPQIAGTVVEEYLEQVSARDLPDAPALTAREREVLQLIAEGVSTKKIADRLYVSVKTVESHRHNIMEKLGLRTTAELTKYAIREGLTSLDT
jgi:two-component system response regulator NreC